MEKLFKIFKVSIATTIFVYLFSAFVHLTFNTFEMFMFNDVVGRFCFGFILIISNFIYLLSTSK